MQRIDQYEAELHPGVQERFGLRDDLSGEKASNVVTFPHVANVRSVDPELLHNENKLGCARGVIWAFIFEAALIIAIAVFWKLRFFLR